MPTEDVYHDTYAPKAIATGPAKPSIKRLSDAQLRAARASSSYNQGGSISTYKPTAKAISQANYKPTAPASINWNDPNYSGFSDTGDYSNYGGSADSGAISMPAAPPPIPTETITIPDAKSDETYKLAVAGLARAKGDFDAQQGLARSQYDRQFGDVKSRMGYLPGAGANGAEGWSEQPIQGAYGQSIDANRNDFAGRGLGRSSMYADALGGISRDFTDRLNTVQKAQVDDVNTQGIAKQAFTGTQDAMSQAALQDAVAKIAAKLNISLGQVPTGTGDTTLTRNAVTA